MTIDIKKNSDEVVFEISGRLDTTTAPALDKALNEDALDVNNLVLDLKGLEYVSSAGLRVLLSTQKRVKQNGKMKIKNVCENVMEIFEMTGFADVFSIEN